MTFITCVLIAIGISACIDLWIGAYQKKHEQH